MVGIVIKAVRSALLELGFVPLTRNRFWCDGGVWVHVVSLLKDRYGKVEVVFTVWHPGFLGDAVFQPAAIQSPISASVSPQGVADGYAWDDLQQMDPALLSAVVTQFFSCFSSVADFWNGCDLDALFQFYKERLDSVQEVDSTFVGSRARYPLIGKKLGLNQSASFVRQWISALFIASEFSMVPAAHDVVVIRERAPLVDCICAMLSPHAVFVSMYAFEWSRLVWRADKRMKGTYWPVAAQSLEMHSGSRFLRIEDLPTVNAQEVLQRVLAGSRSVFVSADEQPFLSALSHAAPSLAAQTMGLLGRRG